MSARQLQFHLKVETSRRPIQLELPFVLPFHSRE